MCVCVCVCVCVCMYMLLVQLSVHSFMYSSIYILLYLLGLPAVTLVTDRIYWTQSDDNVIYYASRNERDNIINSTFI